MRENIDWSGRDDDRLMAALEQALHPEIAVPERFLDLADSCYTWRLFDAELATLAYDSDKDLALQSTTRTESAALRALTFETSDLVFELELTPEGLAGQLVPAAAGELELQLIDGRTNQVPTNKFGYFQISPVPETPFRLCCRFDDGRVVTTVTITL